MLTTALKAKANRISSTQAHKGVKPLGATTCSSLSTPFIAPTCTAKHNFRHFGSNCLLWEPHTHTHTPQSLRLLSYHTDQGGCTTSNDLILSVVAASRRAAIDGNITHPSGGRWARGSRSPPGRSSRVTRASHRPPHAAAAPPAACRAALPRASRSIVSAQNPRNP